MTQQTTGSSPADGPSTATDKASPAPQAPTGVGSVSTAQTDFARDAGPTSLSEAARDYWQRVRGGDVGALPAIAGLIVLVLIFSNTTNGKFFTVGNLANLPAQAAATILIAMGLVFVLLLGEIDLAAGTASGVCAGVMALALNHDGGFHGSTGTGTWLAFVVLMAVALAVAALAKLWYAAGFTAVGLVLLVTPLSHVQVLAILLAICIGVGIGTLTGALVARVGIPSFVVTLALFLAWQGVLLQLEGEGNAIAVRNFGLINALANKNVPPLWGWIIFLIAIVGYVGYTLFRSTRRRSEGLSAEPLSLVLVRGGALTVVGALCVWFLNQNRGLNPNFPIKGMPYVVPIILVLMVFWTLILNRTRFGRYVYAVGGNAEAARRAGIEVPRIRVAVFAIGSAMAAIGGVVAASKLGGVPSDAGGGNQLLYAVGAAVVGGTSLFGGRGKARDAVLGGLVIMMIPNGLGLMGLSSSYNFMVTGIVLLVAASVDALSRKRAAVSGR
ncbi:MAG: sugar ABC transporter permease [Motilibacteraceae bacterium]